MPRTPKAIISEPKWTAPRKDMSMHYEIRYHRKSDKSNVFYAIDDSPEAVHKALREIHPRMRHPRATLERIDKICRHVRSLRPRELFCIYESLTTKLSLSAVWGIEPHHYTIMIWNHGNDSHRYDDVYRDVAAYDEPMLRNALDVYAPQLKGWPWRRPAPPYPKWEISSPRSGKAIVKLQDHLGIGEKPENHSTLTLWEETKRKET